VLARAAGRADVEPGLLRRVQVAAIKRGNRPLAEAVAAALAAATDEASDWPADAGASFADASRAALADAPATTPTLLAQLPAREVTKIQPRTRQEYVRVLPTRVAAGFARPANAPVYAAAGSELVAFAPKGPVSRALFSVDVEFLEHAVLCGETLVVPDMERLFAVDYRTGELRWELALDRPRLLESLGVTNGVLHVLAQPEIPDGNSELIGVEPLTGARLFQRSLKSSDLKPKPIEGQLLLMSVTDDGAKLERLDPVTGRATARVDCSAAIGPDRLQLRPDSLATRLYPQGITGDATRVYLPVDGQGQQNAAPQVIALADDGAVAWRWTGSPGASLVMAQRAGARYVVVEGSAQQPCRAVVLSCADGAEQAAIDVGYDANVLNWERSWLHNPAPDMLTIGSEVDRKQHQRQLVCVGVDGRPSFVIPLRPTDGDVERAPQFGDGFVTFGVRPRTAGASFRVYAVDLETRRGAFEGNTKDRPVRSAGAPHGMTSSGPYTVLSTTQGLILLGDPNDDR
jgi:hypothetical protein